MSKIRNLISKLKEIPKMRYVTVLTVIIVGVTIAIPTLSRYKNRINIEGILSDANNWNGEVATSYHSGTGTSNDPYIISNAQELAYFEKQLEETNYENTYFKLNNNIIINNGTFGYNSSNVTYEINQNILYIKEYTADLYGDETFSDEKIASINKFNTLDSFKGYFDGDYYSIYGLYITDDNANELALFTNLSGTVENLYLENTLIYGGSTTASLASTMSNATVKDIYIEGNIVGTKDINNMAKSYDIEDILITKNTETYTQDINLPIDISNPLVGARMSGVYTSTQEGQKLKIDNIEISPGEFDIELPTSIITNAFITIDDELPSEIALTNLKFSALYEENVTALTSGVVGTATNSKLTNIINKANVYGTNEASGILAKATNTNLKRAYNTGKVTAEFVASGLIGTIENSTNTVTISKVYNDGELTSILTNSFINTITNNENVKLENLFNTQTTIYGINTVDSPVTITNVIDVNVIGVNEGTTTGNITTSATISEINGKDYLLETLEYGEYIDATDLKENSSNAWVYEEGYLPILYFDNLNNPLATLYVGSYSWNDLGYDLRKIYLTSSTAFQIKSNDELNQYKEAYYYIHKEDSYYQTRDEVLSITAWTEYTGVQTISEEGYYTIYVKLIDKNDNEIYINSETLVIDLEEPVVTLTMSYHSWDSLKEELTTINILENQSLTVTAEGNYAEIETIKYHISNTVLTTDELNSLSSDKWLEYSTAIELTECGNYVINIRVTDAAGRIKYINSDYIVFGGYTETISLGREETEISEDINITNKSSISYNFKYQEDRTYQDGDKNIIITNMLLPKNTIMTLINNKTHDVYSYKIETSANIYGYNGLCTSGGYCNKTAKYPLSLFTKLGQTSKTAIFSDEDYINTKEKDLTLVVDFSKAEITKDFSLKLYLQQNNKNSDIIVSTLLNTIKPVNVYHEQDSELIINKLNNPETINYNSDSETNVNFETYIAYKTTNEKTIYDTTMLTKKIGLAIKLVDSNKTIIEKKHLKNIEFKVGENYYSPDNDGIVRINLSSNLENITSTLTIITNESNTTLDLGDYNFVITPFIAVDGKYTSELSTNSITLPVTVTNKKETDYGFNVNIKQVNEDESVTNFTNIIDKYNEENEEIKTTTLKLKVNNSLSLKNKSIRLSLYKKSTNSATDQTYELIELQDYVTNNMVVISENIYDITTGTLTIEIDNSKLENTGYEFRFELYDGERKVSTIKKKFIAK